MNNLVHWEIPTTDMERSTAFYTGLFGWRFEAFSPQYAMFGVEGGVGGALTQVDRMPEPCIEVYIGVDDIPGVLARAEELGASVIQPKTEIGEGMGFWAAFADPCDCRIGIWAEG